MVTFPTNRPMSFATNLKKEEKNNQTKKETNKETKQCLCYCFIIVVLRFLNFKRVFCAISI